MSGIRCPKNRGQVGRRGGWEASNVDPIETEQDSEME